MFTWYRLADLCRAEGIAFVLGHALSMKAIHGGKAKNDRIDAKKIAVLLRGGMLPEAYVYPPELTRDLLRRRLHFTPGAGRGGDSGGVQQEDEQDAETAHRDLPTTVAAVSRSSEGEKR
jgi:hypothetical protein